MPQYEICHNSVYLTMEGVGCVLLTVHSVLRQGGEYHEKWPAKT